jgi:signal transduction histidine kinase
LSAKIIRISEEKHILSVTRDISDRKKAEEEIKQINEQLRKLNIEKDKFFTIIAHDLRNPLTAFMGLTEVMVDELPVMDISELREIAENMKESAISLNNLLENLLAWSQMERGLIPFNPLYINLLPVVNECLSLMREQAGIKEIEITCYIPSDIQIYADASIFQSIIRNLVSNAVKFSRRGGKISVSAKKATDDCVEISIRDYGIGMNISMAENLFRLDAQTNRIGTEGEPSTGLGLILCKDFIEKHGGRIWVESEEGKGSVFYFTIPGKVQQSKKY